MFYGNGDLKYTGLVLKTSLAKIYKVPTKYDRSDEVIHANVEINKYTTKPPNTTVYNDETEKLVTV